MFQANKKLMSLVALGLVLLPSIHAQAAETGKIYLNGEWQEAKQLEQVSAWNASAFFSHKEPLSLQSLASAFLDQNARLLGADETTKWENFQQFSSPELSTIKAEKTWNGIPVLGGETLIHFSEGKVLFSSGDNTDLGHLSTTPSLSKKQAQEIAFASYQGQAARATEPKLKVVLLNKDNGKEALLAYEVSVYNTDGFSSDIHYIDAQRGDILLSSTNVQTIMDRRILAGKGSNEDLEIAMGEKPQSNWDTVYADSSCSREVQTSNFKDAFSRDKKMLALTASLTEGETPAACNNQDARVIASATAAWNNSGLVHEYYHSSHQRDSIDNKGMEMRSVVNFGTEDFMNAAWIDDQGIMVYGNGDGVQLNDFALALDVAAHELTHGITSHSANLEYADESGALNESYSDVFGKLIAFKFGKTDDWKLGKDLFRDGKSFIRDMENPKVAHTRDYRFRGEVCRRGNDYCGVHSNSGIPNKAAVLLAKSIGLEKLGKIYYLTLTQLLRSKSNFKEARAQTEQACATLYGKYSSTCQAVGSAFLQVGI